MQIAAENKMLMMPVLLLASVPCSPQQLGAELDRLIFMNNGTVLKTDIFEYVPMKVSYNVSVG